MIYELRQYTVAEGRMEECQDLFRDVVHPVFLTVGIRPMGYWQPLERDGRTFVYLLAFDSAEARKLIWPKFVEDPRRQAAANAFPEGAPPYENIVPTVLELMDYSPRP